MDYSQLKPATLKLQTQYSMPKKDKRKLPKLHTIKSESPKPKPQRKFWEKPAWFRNEPSRARLTKRHNHWLSQPNITTIIH